MKELFEVVSGLHQRRPDIKKTATWYAKKVDNEEASEFASVVKDDPTFDERFPILDEGSDVIACVIQTYMSVGIGPELALLAFEAKMEEIAHRPPEHFERGIRERETVLFKDDLP